MKKETYSTGDIAKRLHVASRTVVKWIDSGKLKGYRTPENLARRVTHEALKEFVVQYKLPLAWIGETSA